MPKKAATARTEQLSTLTGRLHDLEISPALESILEELEKRQSAEDFSIELNPFERANIRLGRKAFKEQILYPTEVVKECSSLRVEHIRLLRLKASYKMEGGICEGACPVNKKAPSDISLQDKNKDKEDECYKGYYEALLDEFESGFKDNRLQAMFNDLKKNLFPLIARIQAKNFQHDHSYFKGEFDVKKQTEFAHRIARDIGFDTEAGRLDISTDPLTGTIHPSDLRMTTHYVSDNTLKGITGTLHETGHALYEQGRNMEHSNLPDQFQGPAYKNLQSATPEQIYEAMNRVEPGFFQAGADGVSHPLHVTIRYEIEKGLIEGDVAVSDVPKLWNAKMKEYLGVGCFQNIHWALGVIGYFPTYTIGSMSAVQIFGAAKAAIPNLDRHLANGEFHVLKHWLNENIHQQGSLRESGDDLMRDLTGRHLDSSLFVQYLNAKFTEIYGL
ncbi:hypothetical protein BGX28_001309 [Mortierella sp. GBA30]|nr:hypothetical protein BGX28_001309 [Mortierella sp. GBA30]